MGHGSYSKSENALMSFSIMNSELLRNPLTESVPAKGETLRKSIGSGMATA
jgi:hypothetical protein